MGGWLKWPTIQISSVDRESAATKLETQWQQGGTRRVVKTRRSQQIGQGRAKPGRKGRDRQNSVRHRDGAPQKITILLTDSGKKTSAELVKRLRNTAAPTRNDQRIVVVVARGYPTQARPARWLQRERLLAALHGLIQKAVCENMHALGANLRKLASQAKICTPPGGALVAKICKLRTNTVY